MDQDHPIQVLLVGTVHRVGNRGHVSGNALGARLRRLAFGKEDGYSSLKIARLEDVGDLVEPMNSKAERLQ